MIWHVKTGPKGMASTGRLARVLFVVAAAAHPGKTSRHSMPAGVHA
jgi:hypothetical protein